MKRENTSDSEQLSPSDAIIKISETCWGYFWKDNVLMKYAPPNGLTGPRIHFSEEGEYVTYTCMYESEMLESASFIPTNDRIKKMWPKMRTFMSNGIPPDL